VTKVWQGRLDYSHEGIDDPSELVEKAIKSQFLWVLEYGDIWEVS